MEQLRRTAAQPGVGWIWPHWLERQLDPRSTSFVLQGQLQAPANVTLRNWTVVGTVASGAKGTVDPRGLLTPIADGWSLDWWIGAEDRWHFPSREAAVRQQLVEDTPVVETAMRIPGGDAVQRVYGVPHGMAVVEITNATSTPIAVGLAIRPYNPEGLAVVERIGLRDRTVTVDGRTALLLDKRPQRLAASTFAEGDVVQKVTSEDLATELPEDRGCEAGLATATFLFPLAHRQTMRVVIPLGAQRRSGRRRIAEPERAPERPGVVPESDAVVRSWQAQTSRRGMRLVLPEGRLASAVEANRRHLLLFHEGDHVVSGAFRRSRFREAASLLAALDRYGFQGESAEVLASFAGHQRSDGRFSEAREERDANGAALAAMAEHWRLTGVLDPFDVRAVAKGVRWIARRHAGRRGSPVRGSFDGSYGDGFWSLRGLLDGAALLRAFGLDPLADQAERSAASLRTELETSMASAAARLGTGALPAAPNRRLDADAIATLAACSPLRLFPADAPVIEATAQAIRERFCVGPAFHQGTGDVGLAPALTLRLASVELEAGDRAALERLAWIVDAASTTSTWPDAIHPGVGGGCSGEGHSGTAAAEFLSFVRHLLVREVGDDQLVLCSMLPDAWTGQNLEVHDAPTHFGSISFAVRYHGDRPALLWDLKVRDGAGPVRLSAPGLDAAWATTEAKGEALLAAASPREPGEPVVVEGSFS